MLCSRVRWIGRTPYTNLADPPLLPPLCSVQATMQEQGQLRYSGGMHDGRMHGKGEVVYPNGEVFEGELVFGKRHGWGKYT